MSRRIRVLTVVTRFQAGAGAVALRGAQGLDPDRFEVRFLVGRGDRLIEEAARAGFDIRVEPTLRSSIAPRDETRALRRISDLLRREHVDVVHTHSAKAGVIGRLAARQARVPRIVHTYHGFPFHEFQSPLKRAVYVDIERHLGRFTDVGLCVGSGVAVEAVRRRLIAPERIRTIEVAVDDDTATPRTPSSRMTARARLGLPVNAAVVGAVGRLAYQKAPEDFVRALSLSSTPGVVGVWIGSGEREALVRRAIEQARPVVPVILAGERSDVSELLPALDVFALPSRYEGVPVAIVEAMRAGVPVVATAVNAVSDVVVPGVSGLLVPPQEPRMLADAIDHLLADPELARAMAVEAQRRLAGRYDTASLAGTLTAAYLPSEPRPTSVPIRPRSRATAEGSSRAR
jgi:glycosyltransferase involved in cell wall biosynthesis